MTHRPYFRKPDFVPSFSKNPDGSLSKTFRYPLEKCTTAEKVKKSLVLLLRKLEVHEIGEQRKGKGKIQLRCMYCDNPEGQSKNTIAFGVRISTTKDNGFSIEVAVTHFAGNQTLFERKAIELLEQDPLPRRNEGSSQKEKLRYRCKRCDLKLKMVKRRPENGLGPDYANPRKHMINKCPRRSKKEQDLVKTLMVKKGKGKGRPVELTMSDIQEEKELSALHQECKTATGEMKKIYDDAVRSSV